jgi:Leucine-rich repeat (LRR) protein
MNSVTCWRFVVLSYFILFLTTDATMAARIVYDRYAPGLHDVRLNENNEIDFPSTLDQESAQKFTEIKIWNSKFPYFPRNFFKAMPNLKILGAQDCGIVTLKIFGLHSSENLTGINNLYLDYNLVETLEAYSFQQTRNLKHLYMKKNRLSHIDALAFYGLAQLEHLILSDNQLTRVVSNIDIFHDNVKLKYLKMANNKLSTLQATLENNVIDYIDLSGNQLVDISGLSKMNGMHDLKLADNKEVDLFSVDFSKMVQLIDLDLSGVNLPSKLNNNYQFFKSMPQLSVLSIDRNNLTSLSQFPVLPEIHKLTIEGNEISNLDVNALKAQFPKLDVIIFGDNPWNCQDLPNVVDQLLKLEITLPIRNMFCKGAPAGTVTVRYGSSSIEIVSTYSEVAGDIDDYNIDVW